MPLRPMTPVASAVSLPRTDGSIANPGISAQTANVATRGGRVDRTRQEFEAFVLQSMLGAMVPKETAKLFGTGPAGRMWTSLLVEKMAAEISAGGRLRLISDETFARSTGKGEGPVSTAPAGVDFSLSNPALDRWETLVHIDAPFAVANEGAAASTALAALDSWKINPRSER